MTKRVYFSALLGSLLLLAGCGGQESQIPEQPSLTPNASSSGQTATNLNGRVIDGYLRYARVWLDVNENFQWDADEPATMSGEGGAFTFTTEQMGDLGSPRQYLIMVQALPGITVDEDNLTDNNESLALVDRAFIMAAPPGSINVTPLSTLVVAEYDNLRKVSGTTATYSAAQNLLKDRLIENLETFLTNNVGTDEQAEVEAKLTRLAAENLLQDYVNNSEYALWAYAKALVITQQNSLEGISPGVVDNFLTNVTDSTTQILLKSSLRASESIFKRIIVWAGSLTTRDELNALDFSSQSSLLNLNTNLENPDVLYERVWYASKNSTSLTVDGEYENSVSLFEIPSRVTIDADYTDVSLDDLLENSKTAGKVRYSRTSQATVHSTYIDGGVDFYPRLMPDATARVEAEFNLFSTEIIVPDDIWDMSVRLFYADYEPDPDNPMPPVDGVKSEFELVESPAISQLTEQHTRATPLYTNYNVSGSVATHTYRIGNAPAYMTQTFSYAGSELESDALVSDVENLYRYYCRSGGQTDSIRVFTSAQADVATACSATPDFSMAQYYYTSGGLGVVCYSSDLIAGQHFCQFPLLDTEGRVSKVITRRRTGAITEDLDPNSGALVLVEERRYTPLSDAIDLKFEVAEETDAEEDEEEDSDSPITTIQAQTFEYIETLLPETLE